MKINKRFLLSGIIASGALTTTSFISSCSNNDNDDDDYEYTHYLGEKFTYQFSVVKPNETNVDNVIVEKWTENEAGGSPAEVKDINFFLDQKYLSKNSEHITFKLTIQSDPSKPILGHRILPLKIIDNTNGKIIATKIIKFILITENNEMPDQSFNYLCAATVAKPINIFLYPFSAYDRGIKWAWNQQDFAQFISKPNDKGHISDKIAYRKDLAWCSDREEVSDLSIDKWEKFTHLYPQNEGFWNYTCQKILSFLFDIPGFDREEIKSCINLIQVNDLTPNWYIDAEGNYHNDGMSAASSNTNRLSNELGGIPGMDRGIGNKYDVLFKQTTVGVNEGDSSFNSSLDILVNRFEDRYGSYHEFFHHAILDVDDEYRKNSGDNPISNDPTGQIALMDKNKIQGIHLIADYKEDHQWYSSNSSNVNYINNVKNKFDAKGIQGFVKDKVIWYKFLGLDGYENIGESDEGTWWWSSGVYTNQNNGIMRNGINEWRGARWAFNGWHRFVWWWKFVYPNTDRYYDWSKYIDPDTKESVTLDYNNSNFDPFKAHDYYLKWWDCLQKEVDYFMSWDHANLYDKDGKLIVEDAWTY